MPYVRGKPAPRGCSGKKKHANGEYEAASVEVARSAAQQNERCQKERVRFHHPLRVRNRGAECMLDAGQSDVYHRSINECQAGTENCGGQYPCRSRDRDGWHRTSFGTRKRIAWIFQMVTPVSTNPF